MDATGIAARVASIHIDGNRVDGLEGMSDFDWPELRILTVADNRVAVLPRFGACAPKLRALDLSGNDIALAIELVGLAGCQSLESLDIRGNPIMHQFAAEGRDLDCFFVFLLPGLATLNGRAVTSRDQEEARMVFCADDAEAAGIDSGKGASSAGADGSERIVSTVPHVSSCPPLWHLPLPLTPPSAPCAPS